MSSHLPATAPISPSVPVGSFDYAAWAAGLAAVEIGKDVRFFERPTGDFAERLCAARAAAVGRLICGFLPDEVAWPAPDDDLAAWAMERWEFRPYRIAEPLSPGREQLVCWVTDPSGGGDPVAEPLGRALAEQLNRRFVRIDPVAGDPGTLARQLVGAAVVVNDVADWSLGFALDEWAARWGRPVLRLHAGAYSPLRYGVLGQGLRRTGGGRPAPVRAVLAPVLAPPGWAYAGAEWLTGDHCWRTWYSSVSYRAFWGGLEGWSGGATEPARAEDWVGGRRGWAALAAAVRDARAPRSIGDCAGGIVAGWLVQRMYESGHGPADTPAPPRWVRWYPEWILQYIATPGSDGAGSAALAGWVAQGATLCGFGAPVAAFVQAARPVLAAGRAEVTALAPVLAWAEDWTRLPGLVPAAASPAPWLRPACLEAFWCGLARYSSGSPHGAVAALGPVLGAGDVWRAGLGAAAPFLRIRAALALGRRDLARTAWRQELRAAGVSTRGGLARLWRQGLPGDAAMQTVAVELADRPGNLFLDTLPVWLETWCLARQFELWFRERPAMLQRELGVASRLAATVGSAAEGGGTTAWLRLCVWLAAWNGRVADADSALAALSALDPTRASLLACQTGLVLALAGDCAGGRRLLAWCTSTVSLPAPAVFLHAVTAELLGEPERAAGALRQLREKDPAFLGGTETEPDRRWAWATAVFRHGGRRAAVACCLRAAEAGASGNRRLAESVAWGAATLAEEWSSFVPEAAEP